MSAQIRYAYSLLAYYLTMERFVDMLTGLPTNRILSTSFKDMDAPLGSRPRCEHRFFWRQSRGRTVHFHDSFAF